MHLLWDAQRQAGTGYAHAVHLLCLFVLRPIKPIKKSSAYVHPSHIDTNNCHEDYQHYTVVTSALDYKWTGIMDMEILLFLNEDAVTGCKSIV